MQFVSPNLIVREDEGEVEVCLTASIPAFMDYTVDITAFESSPVDAEGEIPVVQATVSVACRSLYQ